MMLPDQILIPALNVMLLSVVVALLTLLLVRCTRSLVGRHAVLVTGLAVCVMLPIPVAIGWSFSLGRLPGLELPADAPVIPLMPEAPNMEQAGARTPDAQARSFDEVSRNSASIGEAAADGPLPEYAAAASSSDDSSIHAQEAEVSGTAPLLGDHVVRATAVPPRIWRDFLRSAAGVAVLLWFSGTAVMGVRLGIGLVRVRRLLRTCVPFSDSFVDQMLREIAAQLGLKRLPRVLHASYVPAPVVVGFRRPVVVLSRTVAAELTPEQLRSVLLHECAHIARGDHRTVLLQAIAGVLYWWNPLLHRISRLVAQVRELICDDAVLVAGGGARSYATSILALAERACAVPPPLAKLGISMSPVGELEQRMRRILAKVARESRLCASRPLRAMAIGVGAVAVMASLACQFPAVERVVTTPAIAATYDIALPNPELTAVIVVRDKAGDPIEGAWVAIRVDSEFEYLPPVQSDAQGRAVHDYPADERIRELMVWKDHVGVAHAGFDRAPEDLLNLRGERVEFPRDQAFEVVLRGAVQVRVRVQDVDGAPIPDALVIPHSLTAPGLHRGTRFDTNRVFWQRTDVDGMVLLDWIDSETTHMFFRVYPSERTHSALRWNPVDIIPSVDGGTEVVVITLERLVSLLGQVVDQDGVPLSGVRVVAIGHSADPQSPAFEAVTDGDGRYAVHVDPMRAYVVAVQDAQWGSETRAPIVVQPDTPVDGLDLVARPATRVRGTLVHRTTGLPIADQSVVIYRSGEILAAHRDLGLPLGFEGRDSGVEMYVGPIIAKSDVEGRFEFALGAGRYRVTQPLSDPEVAFVIAGERELRLRLESVRDGFHDFTGRILLKEGGAPAQGVMVTGQRRLRGRQEWNVVTDAEGSFQVRRDDHLEIIYAITTDRQRVGIGLSTSIDEPFELPLVDAATIVGRIVREADGLPLAGERIRYQLVWPDDPNWGGSRPLHGTVVTHEDGRFEIDGVAPGWMYRVSFGRPPGFFLATNVVLEPGERRDLSTFRRDVERPRLLIYGPPHRSDAGQVWLHHVDGIEEILTASAPMLSQADLTGARLKDAGTVVFEVDLRFQSELTALHADVAQKEWTVVVVLDGRVIAAQTIPAPANFTEAREISLEISDDDDIRTLLELFSGEGDRRD